MARDAGGASALASKIGVSESGLRKWIRGESEPDRSDLINISRATGYALPWLMTGEGPKRAGETAVAEPRPAYTPRPLDEDLLIAVLEAIAEHSAELQVQLTREKTAELAGIIYAMSGGSRQGIDRPTVLKLIKLAS